MHRDLDPRATLARLLCQLPEEAPAPYDFREFKRRAAQRALAEAKARRQATAESARPMPKEFQGPTGPEPTRYGDWENKGIASDF